MSFERHEAEVDYDPLQCRIDDLLAAIARIHDPSMPATFGATVKKE